MASTPTSVPSQNSVSEACSPVPWYHGPPNSSPPPQLPPAQGHAQGHEATGEAPALLSLLHLQTWFGPTWAFLSPPQSLGDSPITVGCWGGSVGRQPTSYGANCDREQRGQLNQPIKDTMTNGPSETPIIWAVWKPETRGSQVPAHPGQTGSLAGPSLTIKY